MRGVATKLLLRKHFGSRFNHPSDFVSGGFGVNGISFATCGLGAAQGQGEGVIGPLPWCGQRTHQGRAVAERAGSSVVCGDPETAEEGGTCPGCPALPAVWFGDPQLVRKLL